MHDVSVIIVNYNGKKYIDNLFVSLEKLVHDDFTFEVVFVDNHSSDDSVKYIEDKRYNLDIKILRLNENKGFAGGNNCGVEHSDGEYIVFLNNDTAVDTMWLSKLYHYIKETGCGMVNSKLLFFYDFVKVTFCTKDKIIINRTIKVNGKEYYIDSKFCKKLLCEQERMVCFGDSEISIPLLDGVKDCNIELEISEISDADKIMCCKHAMDKSTISDGRLQILLPEKEIKDNLYSLIQNAGSGIDAKFNGYDIGFGCIDSDEYSKPYEINNGCGAAIIMKKRDFIDSGKFDETFFMYYEDTDLSYRLKKLGKKIMFCPYAVVRHIHTGSSTEWSDFFLYHVYRNKLLFVWKNISRTKFLKYFIRQLADGIKNSSKARKRGTMDALRIIIGCRNIHY